MLLHATGLEKIYATRATAFRRASRVSAVAGVDLRLSEGGALGLVGESGCGKSTLARLLLRLIPLTAGRILFEGQDITNLPEAALRPRRARMQLIHQNPSAALDPRLSVAAAVAEPLRIHGHDPRARVPALLAEVGLPADFLHRYPHELSGGQKQRVCIARALALQPRLLILDEPTSSLDVSVQAQVLELLAGLRAQRGLAFLFISHNLAVVRQVCEQVAVMYLGRVVEQGATDAVLGSPRHPYTRALLASVPRLGAAGAVVAGEAPNPAAPPPGCPFHRRCAIAQEVCRHGQPPELRDGVACHLAR